MRQLIIILTAIFLIVSTATISADTLEQRAAKISRAEMQGVMEFLSHDLL